MSESVVRITGGVHRSRRLAAPRGTDTRPTSDRVREAVFSILAAHGRSILARGDGTLGAQEVLDLYAGTGALGIEALSRGARHAIFVERGREALAALRANLATLRLDGVSESRVVASPVERAVRSLTGARADLVFADAPYALVRSGEVGRVLGELAGADAFAPGARVVVEHAAADAPPVLADGGLSLDATRRYGDTSVSFYLFGA